MNRLVKICGLSTPEMVDAAIDHGATHIGLVHYAPSPRHVSLDAAAALRRRVPERVKLVLLLVNAEPALTEQAIATVRPDIIQFHGKESPEWMAFVRDKAKIETWKAIGVRDADALDRSARFAGVVDRLLYDTPAAALPGGNGLRFDWSLLTGRSHPLPWGLAGGLTPDNVAEAIRQTGAPLVDVSSGVESAPGVKDVDKIAAFLKAALS